MSDLQPQGIPITLLDGVERHFLFTLSAVDIIQSHYDLALATVIAKLADEREVYDTISYLAAVLINDEIRRSGLVEEKMTQERIRDLIDVPLAGKISRAILRSYGYSLPENDEDDDPNLKGSRSS